MVAFSFLGQYFDFCRNLVRMPRFEITSNCIFDGRERRSEELSGVSGRVHRRLFKRRKQILRGSTGIGVRVSATVTGISVSGISATEASRAEPDHRCCRPDQIERAAVAITTPASILPLRFPRLFGLVRINNASNSLDVPHTNHTKTSAPLSPRNNLENVFQRQLNDTWIARRR